MKEKISKSFGKFAKKLKTNDDSVKEKVDLVSLTKKLSERREKVLVNKE